ncbi:TetR/AcrR family transcriptional regulator [Haliangium ochraceum]|uniref:Transcriptional regulator, TetR family n=1 Tax=Haliangium ochraceum (strain DSM 14365 / JCM 11303 / SMP-2) TaxID=502025 RepID=D0LLU1_HALO1|nr:TetR/AcrR family transcriptional regulator C-terminal domain-containing protein [Haliangium ochraceum]ACY15119.1 transcriptional regulator, TetR family [Haliangium ochraceum DSM 14365]
MPRPSADRRLLNLDLICDTALRLIDRHGLDALSMRKLAAELEVNPKSLYHYVSDKQALLDQVYARMLGKLAMPPLALGSWQQRLRRLASDFRALAQEHPAMVPYLVSERALGERDLELVDGIQGLLAEAGLPPDARERAGQVSVTFLTGFLLSEGNGFFERSVLDERHGLSAEQLERLPHLAALARERSGTTPPGAHFELALELLIAGLEALGREAAG